MIDQFVEERKFLNWDSYRMAYATRRLRSCKSMAIRVFQHSCVDKRIFRVFYELQLFFAMLILTPAVVISYFIWGFSAWYILGALVLSKYLITVCGTAHIMAMEERAFLNEDFFHFINENGGFIDPTRRIEEPLAC